MNLFIARLIIIVLSNSKRCHFASRNAKPTNWHVRPAKTQISLGIHPVWSAFAGRMKKAWVLSYPLSAQRRLWSDWADAHADLSLRWAHMPFCWFCHEAAQMYFERFSLLMLVTGFVSNQTLEHPFYLQDINEELIDVVVSRLDYCGRSGIDPGWGWVSDWHLVLCDDLTGYCFQPVLA